MTNLRRTGSRIFLYNRFGFAHERLGVNLRIVDSRFVYREQASLPRYRSRTAYDRSLPPTTPASDLMPSAAAAAATHAMLATE